ncbi:MAG: hypothetical protein NWQ47_04295 [Crocinitomicaceae bacterium]|nr:hypothetical protein [Crocinitomicaceae bacterium]
MEITRLLINRWFAFFILSGMLFIPFSFQFYSIQQFLSESIFGGLVNYVADLIGIEWRLNDFSSDSKRLVILAVLLLLFSLILAFISRLKVLNKLQWHKTENVIRLIASYYLGWVLLKYGLDKLFKCQFYLPEPNILYSRVGDLDKDILFWSTMGSSYSYNIFMGISEIIPGIFLFFGKTRKLGLLLALGVLLNVVAINFSFDISVKLFSGFLLFIAFYLIGPFAVNLWRFLSNQKLVSTQSSIDTFTKSTKTFHWGNLVVVSIILIESMFVYVKNQNFNDDKFDRSLFHGAYEVEQFIQGKDTLISDKNVLKNLFFHRDSYLIFQFKNEEMVDFKMDIDPIKKTLTLFDDEQNKKIYSIEYNQLSKKMKLIHKGKYDLEIIHCTEKEWKKMPLIQPLFHWTVD